MGTPSEIRLYQHSTLFYWWPVWVAGLVAAVITYLAGVSIPNDDGELFRVVRSSALGITFTGVLLLTILVTNVTLRGIRSVFFILAVAFILMALAWAGVIDNIVRMIPELSVHLTMGFYLTCSFALLLMWALQTFIFDKMAYWRISEGQLTHVRLIGSSQETHDARGLIIERLSDDFLRHVVFGFGSGDIVLRTDSSARSVVVHVRNVPDVSRKVRHIQTLANIEPSSL